MAAPQAEEKVLGHLVLVVEEASGKTQKEEMTWDTSPAGGLTFEPFVKGRSSRPVGERLKIREVVRRAQDVWQRSAPAVSMPDLLSCYVCPCCTRSGVAGRVKEREGAGGNRGAPTTTRDLQPHPRAPRSAHRRLKLARHSWRMTRCTGATSCDCECAFFAATLHSCHLGV
jgi:hypothetical protein